MPILRIIRDSMYADRARAYAVILDQRKVGEIWDGESREFPISEGSHDLRLKIDWCGSRSIGFSASPDELVVFRAGSNLRGLKRLLQIPVLCLAWNRYLRLERAT